MSLALEVELENAFALRDYQEGCLEAIEDNLSQNIRDQLIILPTGAGKTIIFSELIRRKNLKTLVIAHRLELLEQAEEKLKFVAPDIESGVFCGVRKELGKQVTIASIQSASSYKHREQFLKEDFQLLIIDEAHHASARTYLELVDYLGFKQLDKVRDNKASKAGIVLGFTATAKRGDRKALKSVFDKIVYEMQLEDLVERGFLTRPKGLHVTVDIDLNDVQTVMGDYKKLSLRKVMTSSAAREIVAKTIKKFASDRRGIVFSCDIKHAEMLKEDIAQKGFKCAVVHSYVSLERRKKALKDFSDGNLQFLINPMILTEGFDCPIADCMINAAPTLNRALYIQKAGRVLRLHPKKEDALLVDFGYVGEESPLKTAQTLGKYIDVKKLDDKLELMSDEEKKAYEKEQEELRAEEKRKAEEELKLEVLKEQEYDPLAVEKREEEEPEQIEEAKEEEPCEREKRGESEESKDEKELLYLLKFLKFLDVPMIRSPEWKKDITERQEVFIHRLCRRCLEVDPPELLCEISLHQASMLIQSLLEKDGGRLEVTDRQVDTLTKIVGMEREKAESLNFKDASTIIWKNYTRRNPNLCRV
jgi:superfamily II DNA or RNA helicase